MTDNTQPEALRLASSLELCWGDSRLDEAAAELRRQHAHIADLEQEVAHTDSLLGKANALASIRAHRIAELEAQLESAGFTAADMATAEARGFMDGVASVAASAGSDPVAKAPVLDDPLDALRWGANVAETLLSIGRAIGFGRAQQILGEQWDAEYNCAPRGRMGVTAKDVATCQMCGDKPFPGCNSEFQGEAACRFTHPSPPEGAGAEQALRKVLSVVQRYLPPDGPTAHDAMTEITEIVDPWPLGPLEKP